MTLFNARRTALTLILTLVTWTAALADIRPGTQEFEIQLGYYEPDPDVLDDDVSFGFRWGSIAGERFGLFGEVGYYDGSADAQVGFTRARVDYDALFLDFVAELYLNPDGATNVSVFGGGGWVFASVDVVTSVPGFRVFVDRFGDDSFSLQAGAALRFDVTDKFFLRPAARLRWFEARDGDDVDQELLLAFGFRY